MKRRDQQPNVDVVVVTGFMEPIVGTVIVKALSELGRKYGIVFTEKELSSFRDYIYENPMMSMKHDTGIKLYGFLKKIYDSRDYTEVPTGTVFFRGRLRNEDCPPHNDLWNPKLGLSSEHGRYNSIGIPVLYCCNNTNGIPYEISPSRSQVIDVGRFVTKKVLKKLNVVDTHHRFEWIVTEKNNEDQKLRKNYIYTNFIAGCCKDIGFDILEYNPLEGISCSYNNFAFLSCRQDEDLDINERYVYKFRFTDGIYEVDEYEVLM